MKLVSVIIPSYNYAEFISETLNSILDQTYKHWECIIVDDGSTDNTKSIVSRFLEKDNRFKYIYQKNKGLSSARNTGLSNSNGEYFQFLDADDLIEKQKLEAHVNFLEENMNIDIVYGEMERFINGNQSVRFQTNLNNDKSWMPKCSGNGDEILNHLVKSNIMVVSSPLIRSNVVDSICFDIQLKAMEDWDFWIRCAMRNFNFFFLKSDSTKTLIRSHSDSMMSDELKMFLSEIQIRKKISIPIVKKELIKLNKIKLRETYGALTLYYFKNRKYFKGIMTIFNVGYKKFFYYSYHSSYWMKKGLKKNK